VLTLVNNQAITGGPKSYPATTSGTILPAFLQFEVRLAATDNQGWVELTVCGRTD